MALAPSCARNIDVVAEREEGSTRIIWQIIGAARESGDSVRVASMTGDGAEKHRRRKRRAQTWNDSRGR